MTAIEDFQFELLPSITATDGEVFGIGADVSMDDGGFHPGASDWAVQDSESSATGATLFGRDKLLGPTWSFDLHVDQDDTEEAVAALSAFSAAWRAIHIRDTPGMVIPLRYSLAGRVRRVYGRPRRCESSPNNLILQGYTAVTADFKCVDGYTYDDAESSLTLTIGADEEAPSGGGFTFPLTFPEAGLPATEQQGNLFIDGDCPTWPIIRFNGPWVSPSITTPDWILSLPDYEIAAGQYVEIDTRPWASTVKLNGGTSIAGKLGRRQSLPGATFKPGSLELNIGGFSSTGTGTCQLTWSSAWSSI